MRYNNWFLADVKIIDYFLSLIRNFTVTRVKIINFLLLFLNLVLTLSFKYYFMYIIYLNILTSYHLGQVLYFDLLCPVSLRQCWVGYVQFYCIIVFYTFVNRCIIYNQDPQKYILFQTYCNSFSLWNSHYVLFLTSMYAYFHVL